MQIDIMIAIILFIFLCMGFYYGFIVEFLSIFGLVVNYYISKIATPKIVEYVKVYYPELTNQKAYIALFVVLYFIVIALLRNVSAFFRGKEKRIGDRMAGAILALGKGGILSLIILAIVVALSSHSETVSQYSENSRAVSFYKEIEGKLIALIPSDVNMEKVLKVENIGGTSSEEENGVSEEELNEEEVEE